MLLVDQEQVKLTSAIHHGVPSWTAEAVTVNGDRLIALRLTDGALVYLHPDIARAFAERILVAVNSK